MFFKLLKHDIKNGILLSYKKYIIVFIAFIIFCIDLNQKLLGINLLIPDMASKGSFADYVLYPFAGMQEYTPRPEDPFVFPVIWMIIYLLLAYITLYYAYNDLKNFGQSILIRTGGRKAWWLSKCVWNILSVITFFLVAWVTISIFCLCTQIPITTSVSNNMISILRLTKIIAFKFGDMTLPIFLLPLITAIAVNLFQMMLSLYIKPQYSFFITAILLLSSAYYLSPYLIGNYLMPVRSDQLATNGVNFLAGISISSCLIVASIVIGCIRFKRYDIFSKAE